MIGGYVPSARQHYGLDPIPCYYCGHDIREHPKGGTCQGHHGSFAFDCTCQRFEAASDGLAAVRDQ